MGVIQAAVSKQSGPATDASLKWWQIDIDMTTEKARKSCALIALVGHPTNIGTDTRDEVNPRLLLAKCFGHEWKDEP